MDAGNDEDGALMDGPMAALNLTPRDEASNIAVSDGDWFDPDTWYNGEIPGDGARVLIPEGIDVYYGQVSDARLFTVRVDGDLEFATDADSRMVFDTMVVSPTGGLLIGTEIDPVDEDVSVDLVIANNGPIDTDWDPTLLSRGIIAMGETKIYGTEKDSSEKVIEDPMAGDTSIMFDAAPEGWAVGDTIVIAGTRYDGYKWDNAIGAQRLYEPEDEVRTISSIQGNEIFFEEPLENDHDTPREDLYTSVANYSRNVTIQTEDPETADVSERGHVMFMHTDDVDVRYAAFYELGRTDKSELSRPASDFDNIESDSNVQARYSLHLHRGGVDDSDSPAIIVGNAVWGSPGWGYVQHDTNAILENNASYDTFGAGFVAETGNETGAWIDNIAIFAQGTSWDIPKNTSFLGADVFDTAKGGQGFWFQGRLIEAVDNVAASVNTGFVYFHRDGDDRMINSDASQFEYPDALDFDTQVTADDIPITIFIGNETFAAREGLHIVKANPNQGHDVWSRLEDFTAWSVKSGAHIEYTSRYILSDFDLIGKEATQFSDPVVGISVGNNTSGVVIQDARIAGFETGIDLVKNFVGDNPGTLEDHDYIVINADITGADEDYGNYDGRYDRILDAGDVTPQTPDLQFDEPLVFREGPDLFRGGGVVIEGTKTDSLGEETFPAGTDTFYIERDEVAGILETQGYWTTTDGQAYFLSDIYMTDRLTGDIYYETQPVMIDESVMFKLGHPAYEYSGAVNNGVQDFVVNNGDTYADGEILDQAILAEQPSADQTVEAAEAASAAADLLWNALAVEQDDTPPVDDTESTAQEEHEMALLI